MVEEVPTLGGIGLSVGKGQCGAVFDLSRPPRRPRDVDRDVATIHFAEGWRHAAVEAESQVTDDDELHATAYDLLQEALDIRSASDAEILEDRDALTSAILWRRVSSGFHITIKHLNSLTMRMDLTWEKLRDGVVIERSEDLPNPEWHESLRFVRRSASAQDVFDAYRNTYLALEALLADRVPQNPSEGEVMWIKRVLKLLTSNGDLDLKPYTQGSPTPETWINEHYEAFRCALFHAKRVGRRHLPARYQDWLQVSEALGRLQPMVAELLRKTQMVSINAGAFTYAGMLAHVQAITREGLEMGRTPDTTVADKQDVELSPNGFAVHWIPGTWSGEAHGRGDLFRFEGAEEIHPEQEVMVVGRVGIRLGGDTLFAVSDIDSLELKGVVSYRHILDLGFGSAGLARNPFRP